MADDNSPDPSRRRRIDWSKAREEYVTGTESFSDIGGRLGVLKSTVEKHASAEHGANNSCSWGKQRAEFRESVTRHFRSEEIERQTQQVLTAQAEHLRRTREFLETIEPVAKCVLTRGDLADAEVARTYVAALKADLAAVAFMRRAFGLDQAPTMTVELSGRDGGAIEHDVVRHDSAVDDINLAQAFLEAVFRGDTEPKPSSEASSDWSQHG